MNATSKSIAATAALAAALLLPDPTHAAPEPSLEGRVVVIPAGDEAFAGGRGWKKVRDLVDRADREGATAVVYDLSASGAHGIEVFREVMSRASVASPRTVAFVNPSATGAAAALALASDTLYLTPTGVIGAALPDSPEVTTSDEDGASRASRRAFDAQVSVLTAQLKAVARVKGRDPATVAALVDPEYELRALAPDDKVVKQAGRPWAIDAEEAVAGVGGHPPIAAGIVADLDALAASEGWDPAVLVLAAEGTLALSDAAAAAPGVEAEVEAADQTDEASDPAAGVAAEPAPSPGTDAAATETAPPASRFGQTKEESFAGHVVVIEVGDDDLLSKARFDFMKRMILKADADGARAIVFDMNTPGGIAWYTSQLMMQELQRIRIPTYTFVNPAAVSAGALIAVATDGIYMAPAATIGAAAVVAGTGQELGESMRDKVNATFISVARNVAELKGHNPDLVEAFIDRDKEVVLEGVVISPKGRLLSLNTTTATEEFGGKPLLARGVATSVEEVLAAEGLQGVPVMRAEPLGMEAVAEWIQRISVVLILVGIVGAYLEMQTPGFGVPGALALLAFTLFFFGNNLAGKLAGYELFVIFGLGVALLAVELLVFPGAVIPGVIGFVLMLGAVLFAMVDQLDVEAIRKGAEWSPGWWRALTVPLQTLMLSLLGSAVLIGLAMAYLPRVPYLNRMVLTARVGGGLGAARGDAKSGAAVPAGGAPRSGGGSASTALVSVGETGESLTDLRPSGRVRIGEGIHEATTDGEFLGAGTAIRVRAVESGSLLVGPAELPGKETRASRQPHGSIG